MSEQTEADDSTSLEDVFNAREFRRASAAGGAGSRDVAGRAGVEIVTKGFDVATRVVAPVLHGNAVVGLNERPLEDILHSARADRPLTLLPPPSAGAPVGAAMPGEDADLVSLDARRPERNRYRAVAAVSGVAAAALVVAGITSGTVQKRPSEVSTQGLRGTASLPGSGHAPGAGGLTPTATLAAAGGDGAGSSPLGTDPALRPGNVSSGQVTLSAPATTSGTAVPAPTAPSGGSPTGAGGGIGAPPPPSGGGSPLAPVTTALGSSVGPVETSVTAATDQLGSSIPSTAPATSAVGTIMSGVGQTASTMK